MTQVKRISPSELSEVVLPAVEEAATSAEPVKVTARVENTVYGACPICHNAMKITSANGIPVHACMEHRIVMPLRDDA